MRIRTLVFALGTLTLVAGVPTIARAQGTGGATTSGPATKKHRAAPSAAQKEYAKALRAEEKSLRAQVKAGTLTKKSAAEQLKAWRQANKPAPKTP